MTKKLFTLSVLFISVVCYSQIPTDYYNTATGTGYTLKTELKLIVTNGHIDRGYGALYDAYTNSDNDTDGESTSSDVKEKVVSFNQRSEKSSNKKSKRNK